MALILLGALGFVAATDAGRMTQADVGPIAPADTSLPLAPLRTVSFTVDEGSAMSVDISPDGRWLAFNMLGQIFTLPVTGGKAKQLTTGPAFAVRPLFTRDGRSIAFQSDQGGALGLWRVALSGGAAPVRADSADTLGHANIFHENPDTLWAPQGKHGVLLPPKSARCDPRSLGVPGPDTVRGVLLVERPTRRVSRLGVLASCEYRLGGVFTPDGRTIITAYGGKLRRIEVPSGRMSVIPFQATVTLRIRPLVVFPHRISEHSLVHARRIMWPRLSPDGSHVVFSAFAKLWLMRLPDGTPRRLTTFAATELEPVWSADGGYIAFSTWTDSGGSDGAIWRMRPDGSQAPERLTREPAHYSNLAYTPDGARLVAVRRPIDQFRMAPVTAKDFIDGYRLRDEKLQQATELTWLSSTGGPETRTSMPVKPYESGCVGQRVRGRPHFVNRRSEKILFSRPLIERAKSDSQRYSTLVAVSLDRSGGATALDTVLRVHDAQTDPYACLDIFPSPHGDRALVMWGSRQRALYLVDVPAGGGPIVTFDTLSAQVRRITMPLSSSEASWFPSWASDSRSFTYAFGRTLYRYDVQRADSLARDSVARSSTMRRVTRPAYVPQAFQIDVTLPRDRPTGTIAFRNARLITMRGNEVIERGDLVVRDRRIVAIGASGKVAIPRDAHVIDATGRTLMPGLLDLHNHAFPMPEFHRTRSWSYEANLAFGVLNSRDPQAHMLDFLTYEDRVATGEILGPRFMSTGPAITPNIHFATREEARAVVHRYADVYNVKYLKSMWLDDHPRRHMQWLVMAAAERGLNVLGHDVADMRVRGAIDGYGGWDHMYELDPMYADVRKALILSGITLANVNLFDVAYFARKLDAAAFSHLARWWVKDDSASFQSTNLDSIASRVAQWAEPGVARFAADGGRLATAAHGNWPGYGTHLDLWMFVERGIPPMEALRIGTLRSAEALGLERDLGTLEVGKLADLLVLDRNPLEKIQHTMDLRYVLSNGRLYDAATLNELWPRARQREPGWWE